MKSLLAVLVLLAGCAPGQPFHRTTRAEAAAMDQQAAQQRAATQAQQEQINRVLFAQRYPYLVFLEKRWHEVCSAAPDADKCADAHGAFLAETQRVKDNLEAERQALLYR